MTPLVQRSDVEVYHAAHHELASYVASVGGCDTLIVDAPYSDRTHAGHDRATASTNRPVKANGVRDTGVERRALDYTAWTPNDVREFVSLWEPLTRGWFVSITDDVLFPAWRDALAAQGRQTFQDVPVIIRGMSVRLVGDGPSSWGLHVVVARPRSKAFAAWGTLDGGYTGPKEAQPVVGGKPLWLMGALVRDYSRPGDLVIDPCCGGGTTLLAALESGRRAIGGDADLDHARIAAGRVDRPVQQPLLGGAW